LEVIDDLYDPIEGGLIASVTEEHRKKIKYSCGPCKPVSNRPSLSCVVACKPNAISHSW